MNANKRPTVGSSGPHQNKTIYPAHSIPLRVNGQTVAVLYPGGTLRKVVKNKHMLVTPPAWAIQAEALERAISLGARTLEVVNSETGVTYTATIDDVIAHGVRFDRGYGLQVALPIARWSVREAA